MTEQRGSIKFKIESSSGTLTDLTPFVKSVEVKPFRPSLWRRLFQWVWWQWFTFRANRSWRKLSKGGATIEIKFERRTRNPWKWN
jgi:hypothetical protein